MTYTLAQKNRWNRFRRNRPTIAWGFQNLSDVPITICDRWNSIGQRAKCRKRADRHQQQGPQ